MSASNSASCNLSICLKANLLSSPCTNLYQGTPTTTSCYCASTSLSLDLSCLVLPAIAKLLPKDLLRLSSNLGTEIKLLPVASILLNGYLLTSPSSFFIILHCPLHEPYPWELLYVLLSALGLGSSSPFCLEHCASPSPSFPLVSS